MDYDRQTDQHLARKGGSKLARVTAEKDRDRIRHINRKGWFPHWETRNEPTKPWQVTEHIPGTEHIVPAETGMVCRYCGHSGTEYGFTPNWVKTKLDFRIPGSFLDCQADQDRCLFCGGKKDKVLVELVPAKRAIMALVSHRPPEAEPLRERQLQSRGFGRSNSRYHGGDNEYRDRLLTKDLHLAFQAEAEEVLDDDTNDLGYNPYGMTPEQKAILNGLNSEVKKLWIAASFEAALTLGRDYSTQKTYARR